MTPKTLITPHDFYAQATLNGVRLARVDDIITLWKSFEAGNVTQYLEAEDVCYRIIRLVPCSRPGSMWGTTSDGVGGYAGIQTGLMRLNRSGVNKNWLKQLSQYLQSIGR